MLQRVRFIPTVTFIPFLYFAGWILVLPLRFISPDLSQENISLAGTITTFIIFISFSSKEKKPLFFRGLPGVVFVKESGC